jgi:hypothetical protein
MLKRNLPLLLGYYLPILIVIYGIFHLAFGRGKWAKAAGIAFFAIFISLVANGLISFHNRKKRSKKHWLKCRKDTN